MTAALRGLVFDLDGTLIDSMGLVLRAYHHALEPYAAPLSDAELMTRMGGPPQRIFEQLLADSSHVSGALRRLEHFARDAWQKIEPFPGALPALGTFRATGCRLGLWTGRERESTEWLLARHGLAAHLEVLVCGDDLPTHKPDPEGLAAAIRQLGLTTADTVFIGDAEVDVLAGVALGVRTVFIRHGNPAAVEAQAWRVVDTPADAYRLLSSLLGVDTNG